MSTLAQNLQKMRALKDAAEQVGRDKKKADEEFKKQQSVCLRRMEADEAESFRTHGYLYTAVQNKVKGRVEDRRLYVRHCLENDESVADFVRDWGPDPFADPEGAEKFEADLFDAITSTSLVQYRESQQTLNQQARSHLDDGVALPPGMTFDPDPSIQMRKS